MNYFISASPGSASKTLLARFEQLTNSKYKSFKSGSGIGHIAININLGIKIMRFLGLTNLIKQKVYYQHFFPSKYNLSLLNYYIRDLHFIITYRNIYDQINYLYKWNEKHGRCPLSFISHEKKNSIDMDDIELNIDLLLNFYKLWFYLIQNKIIKNFTLFSFDEIVSQNKDYEEKMNNLFKNKNILLDISKNIYTKKKFNLNKHHLNRVERFFTNNNHIDFSLIK